MNTCAFCNSQLVRHKNNYEYCIMSTPKIHTYDIISKWEKFCMTENFSFYLYEDCVKLCTMDPGEYIHFNIRNFKPKPKHLYLTSEQFQEQLNKLSIFS